MTHYVFFQSFLRQCAKATTPIFGRNPQKNWRLLVLLRASAAISAFLKNQNAHVTKRPKIYQRTVFCNKKHSFPIQKKCALQNTEGRPKLYLSNVDTLTLQIKRQISQLLLQIESPNFQRSFLKYLSLFSQNLDFLSITEAEI